jgi:hypothetical protein
MKKDNQLLVFTHLSQLLDYITGIGGFYCAFSIVAH